MLSFVAPRHLHATSRSPPHVMPEGVIVPQQLNFLDRAAPKPHVWEQLNDEQRANVIDTMARVIRQAAVPMTTATTDKQEKAHD